MRLRLIVATWVAIAVLTTLLTAVVSDGDAWAIVAVAWIASACTLVVALAGVVRVSRSRSIDVASASAEGRAELSSAIGRVTSQLEVTDARRSTDHEAMLWRTQDLAEAAGMAATDVRDLDRRISDLERRLRDIGSASDPDRIT